jgi:uncharacterized membrane protein
VAAGEDWSRAKPGLTRLQRHRVARAVDEAEWYTGLQICVLLGALGEGDSRRRAEELFVAAGLDSRPAVLVLVGPDQRRVEVVTAPELRQRVTDEAASEAVAEMTRLLALDQPAAALVAGVQHIAAAAGPGHAPEGEKELPDLLG